MHYIFWTKIKHWGLSNMKQIVWTLYSWGYRSETRRFYKLLMRTSLNSNGVVVHNIIVSGCPQHALRIYVSNRNCFIDFMVKRILAVFGVYLYLWSTCRALQHSLLVMCVWMVSELIYHISSVVVKPLVSFSGAEIVTCFTFHGVFVAFFAYSHTSQGRMFLLVHCKALFTCGIMQKDLRERLFL